MQEILDLKKLKASLPRGAITRVARKNRINTNFMAKILRGEAVSDHVIADLVDEAEAYKVYQEELQRRIAAL